MKYYLGAAFREKYPRLKVQNSDEIQNYDVILVYETKRKKFAINIGSDHNVPSIMKQVGIDYV
ncbi:hypothetical protein ACFCYN_20225 [Gottfriedia sp. NPDC056225]|uniref:hypothetical protein n=1 Tax=Gottfriedia sp. NPDC056225 TaxID=3345751 RepID=UPI0015594053|nr:hypothetical protein HPK19_25270 [Arthrobacter citreus]